MDIDLDRYYTPVELAENFILDQFGGERGLCVDTTCGSGNLLMAATKALPGVKCFGLDRDRDTIEKLRRQQPSWLLSVADLLKARSYRKTAVFASMAQSDLLVLNPPFSHGKTKSVTVSYNGIQLKASVAMAHILKSFELFNPTAGALVIVPESALYSETDVEARNVIEKNYHMRVIAELNNLTFSGARVNSSVITIKPGARKRISRPTIPTCRDVIKTDVVRGGLPTYLLEVSISNDAVPYIHTTDLRDLSVPKLLELPRTTQLKRGRVSGAVILLPRVGIPSKEIINAVVFDSHVQLSDCVIALVFSSYFLARKAADRIQKKYHVLLDLYRGTGARYITIKRLKDWLEDQSISA